MSNQRIPNINRWIEDPHAEIEVGDNGGVQSKLDVNWSLVDFNWLYDVASVMTEGRKKYNDPDSSNWRKVTIGEHIEHALAHTIAAAQLLKIADELPAGSPQLPVLLDEALVHLSHLSCRAMGAVSTIYFLQDNINTLKD